MSGREGGPLMARPSRLHCLLGLNGRGALLRRLPKCASTEALALGKQCKQNR